VPKLRFEEFDGEWEIFKLKETFSLFNGFSFKSSDSTSEGFKWVKIADVGINKMNNSNPSYLPYSFGEQYSKFILNEGDFVVALTRPILNGNLKIAKINKEYTNALLNQRVARLVSKNKIEFIYQMLQQNSLIAKIDNRIAGSDPPNLSLNEISTIKLNIPTLPEQQKIASFLTSVDNKIQLLQQKKQALAQYKKGAMQQIFSQQLRFKNEHGNAYPNWEEKKLGEIASRVNNKNVTNNVSFVLTNSATKGIVSQAGYFDREIANQNNLEGYYIVSKDDFVYNPRVSVHAPVGPIKRNKLQKGVMSPLYSVFKFNQGILEYFEYYFETVNWHKYLKSIANYGARFDRMNITNVDFYKMPIPFPCLEEQQKIASFLSKIDASIAQVSTAIQQTQEFKKGLLQQLFV